MTALNAVPWITWIRTKGKQREIGHAGSRTGGRGAATPRRLQGAPRPRPTPARHTGCKLQDAEGRRSESWSRGTATAAERGSRAGLPASAAARPSPGSHAATTHSTWAGEWPSERLSA